MGHLVNPIGFRVGLSKFWRVRVYSFSKNLYFYEFIKSKNFLENIRLNFLKSNILNKRLGLILVRCVLRFKYGYYLFNSCSHLLDLYVYSTALNIFQSNSESSFLSNNYFISKLKKKNKLRKLNKFGNGLVINLLKILNNKRIVKNLIFFATIKPNKYVNLNYNKFINLVTKKHNYAFNKHYYIFKYLNHLKFFSLKLLSTIFTRNFNEFNFKKVNIVPLIKKKTFINANMIIHHIWYKFRRFYTYSKIVLPMIKEIMREIPHAGIVVKCSGRMTKQERAPTFIARRGSVPLSTVMVPIDYSFKTITMKYGAVGIKVWFINNEFSKYYKNI